MNYTIEIAEINDENVETEIRTLIKAAFQTTAMLPANYLSNNIQSNSSQPGFFVVAKENGKIIGCNGFLANDFILNDKPYVGYQSCWSAIDPFYWGKGIFTEIINEAKRILINKGAGFLYGVPSENSLPAMVEKLNFSETPSLILRIPNIPIIRSFFFKKATLDKNNVCSIDEQQVAAHKAAQYPAEVKSFQFNKSLVWGKLVKKIKFGIKFPVFIVGGLQLDKETDLKFLLDEINKAHTVLFFQLISCESNSNNALFRNWKKAKYLKGFVFYNLTMPPFKHFNVMIGAIDVF